MINPMSGHMAPYLDNIYVDDGSEAAASSAQQGEQQQGHWGTGCTCR